jgi:DNA-binding transcriptional ArsR family regulator
LKKEDDGEFRPPRSEEDAESKDQTDSPIYNEPVAEGKGSRKRKSSTDSKSAPQVIDQTPPSPDASLVDAELRGRTLRAYLFILKSPKPIGVRELQRALGLSSPSVAYHHLDKLTRMGLVEKDQYGEYASVKNVNVNVLQAFTQIGRLLVPRFIFYAVFFTTLLLGYILVFLSNLNSFAVAFGLFASLFAWYETYRTWKKRPF